MKKKVLLLPSQGFQNAPLDWSCFHVAKRPLSQAGIVWHGVPRRPVNLPAPSVFGSSHLCLHLEPFVCSYLFSLPSESYVIFVLCHTRGVWVRYGCFFLPYGPVRFCRTSEGLIYLFQGLASNFSLSSFWGSPHKKQHYMNAERNNSYFLPAYDIFLALYVVIHSVLSSHSIFIAFVSHWQRWRVPLSCIHDGW